MGYGTPAGPPLGQAESSSGIAAGFFIFGFVAGVGVVSATGYDEQPGESGGSVGWR